MVDRVRDGSFAKNQSPNTKLAPFPSSSSIPQGLIHFRERMREAVVRIESGSIPAEEFVKEVNSLLEQYPLQTSLRKKDERLVREVSFAPRKPADFWAPIIDAAADLPSETNTSRIRKCESCVVHFLDVSKKGSRRWLQHEHLRQ